MEVLWYRNYVDLLVILNVQENADGFDILKVYIYSYKYTKTA